MNEKMINFYKHVFGVQELGVLHLMFPISTIFSYELLKNIGIDLRKYIFYSIVSGFSSQSNEVSISTDVYDLVLNTFNGSLYFSRTYDPFVKTMILNRKGVTRTFSYYTPSDFWVKTSFQNINDNRVKKIVNVIKLIEDNNVSTKTGLEVEDSIIDFIREPIIRIVNSDISNFIRKYVGIKISTNGIQLDLFDNDNHYIIIFDDFNFSSDDINESISFFEVLKGNISRNFVVTYYPKYGTVFLDFVSSLKYVTTINKIDFSIVDEIDDKGLKIIYDLVKRNEISVTDNRIIINDKTYSRVYTGMNNTKNYYFKDGRNVYGLIVNNNHYGVIKLSSGISRVLIELDNSNLFCDNTLYSPDGVFLFGCPNSVVNKFKKHINTIIRTGYHEYSLFVRNNGRIIILH